MEGWGVGGGVFKETSQIASNQRSGTTEVRRAAVLLRETSSSPDVVSGLIVAVGGGAPGVELGGEDENGSLEGVWTHRSQSGAVKGL